MVKSYFGTLGLENTDMKIYNVRGAKETTNKFSYSQEKNTFF